MFWAAFIFVVAFIVVSIAIVVKRGRQFAALSHQGVETTAGISNRSRRRKRIGFTYQDNRGRSFTRYASVTLNRFAELKQQTHIPVVYLPTDPGVSAPLWDVELARKALQKTK